MKTRIIYFFSLFSFVLLASVQCGEKKARIPLKCAEICLRTELIEINAAKDQVEVNVVLKNPTKDTLWFWATSCWSPQNRLVFDKNKFQELFRIRCEETIPEVNTLLPGQELEIPITFQIKTRTNWLKIGFNLNKSEQYYSRNDIRHMDFPSSFIDKGKTIWAEAISLK